MRIRPTSRLVMIDDQQRVFLFKFEDETPLDPARFGVDEWHGHNAFIRDGDKVFRTYLINGRGDEAMGTTWSYLDITTLGRQETWEDSPEGCPQTPPYSWWNWHDNYNAEASPAPKWIDIITDPQEAARKREAEQKA